VSFKWGGVAAALLTASTLPRVRGQEALTASKSVPTHVRVPQQSEAVAGQIPQSGIVLPAKVVPDPRTTSQDPVLPSAAK
jgi:hypothetical protein